MRVSNRLIATLAVIATVTLGAFLLAVVIPSLFFHQTVPPQYVTYVRIILFFSAAVSIFAIGPLIIYQFRLNDKLQDAINHYVKNKMQEIILAIDLVESNLAHTDTEHMSYDEKVKMLDDVRSTCKEVSGNLAEKILGEAPGFNRKLAKSPPEPV